MAANMCDSNNPREKTRRRIMAAASTRINVEKGAALAQHSLLSQLLSSNPPLLKPRPPKHGGTSPNEAGQKPTFCRTNLPRFGEETVGISRELSLFCRPGMPDEAHGRLVARPSIKRQFPTAEFSQSVALACILVHHRKASLRVADLPSRRTPTAID
jgi:hypothetical protein